MSGIHIAIYSNIFVSNNYIRIPPTVRFRSCAHAFDLGEYL